MTPVGKNVFQPARPSTRERHQYTLVKFWAWQIWDSRNLEAQAKVQLEREERAIGLRWKEQPALISGLPGWERLRLQSAGHAWAQPLFPPSGCNAVHFPPETAAHLLRGNGWLTLRRSIFQFLPPHHGDWPRDGHRTQGKLIKLKKTLPKAFWQKEASSSFLGSHQFEDVKFRITVAIYDLERNLEL